MNKIGVLINYRGACAVKSQMEALKKHGFSCCQYTIWDMNAYTDELAKTINEATKENGVEISTLWCGWSGPCEWNFTKGPVTLGIVPKMYREKRIEELFRGAEFAKKIGVTQIATHAGFLPENMTDSNFVEVVEALKKIANKCAELGINFLFETGQETPVTLLRVIETINMKNVGINMDTANLILYGKGNSADAISVFGKYVKDTHIKDGFYPTNGKELGHEVKVGEGLANLKEVIKRLKNVGYTGNYIIEREIEGDEQIKDILETKTYLETILAEEKIC